MEPLRRRLFGTNGIRGVANRDLTPEFVMNVGMAVGTFFKGRQILVGYDGRTSSPMLTRAAVAGLMSTGCTVYDVGLAPTPASQYAVKHHRTDGAVIITASHNPQNTMALRWLVMMESSCRESEKSKSRTFFSMSGFIGLGGMKLGKYVD